MVISGSSDRIQFSGSFSKQSLKTCVMVSGSGSDIFDRRLIMAICSSDDAMGMGIVRFNLRDVWTDTGDDGTCDVVRLYGEGMFLIQLIAGGPFRSSTERSTLKEIVKG